MRRSAEEPEWFWPAAIEDMGIEFSQPWERVFDDSRGPEWTTWFVGGKVNIARVCVHDWARRTPDAVAAVLRGENGDRREWTYAEFSQEVTRFAEALVGLGVEPGDRVGIFMPMAPAMAVASHACAHIGAVQVPIFSGFAAPAIAQRLQDAEAKVLVTASHSSAVGARCRCVRSPTRPWRRRRRSSGWWSGTARRANGTSSSGRASCRRSRSTRSTPIS